MLHLIDLQKFVPFGHYLVIIHGYILGRVCLLQRFFTAYYKSRLSVGENTTVSFISELLKVRDN